MAKITVNTEIDINNLGGPVTVAAFALPMHGSICDIDRKTKTGPVETIAHPAIIAHYYPAGTPGDLVDKRAIFCTGRLFKHTGNQFRIYLSFEQDGHWVKDSDPVQGSFTGPFQDFQINCLIK